MTDVPRGLLPMANMLRGIRTLRRLSCPVRPPSLSAARSCFHRIDTFHILLCGDGKLMNSTTPLGDNPHLHRTLHILSRQEAHSSLPLKFMGPMPVYNC
jgi:hypothetical protein